MCVTSSLDPLARADRLRGERTPFVLATVVRAQRPTSAKAGDRALVLPDGTIEGFVGGTCAESTVRAQALRLLRSGESTLLRITPGSEDAEPPGEGLVTVTNPCLSGGTLEIFLEPVVPPPRVRVFGDAPIARALLRVGRAMGYDIDAVTDPTSPITPDTAAVVVASHGRDEEAVLTAALRAGVPYVGLIASPRRGAAVVAGLDVDEGDRQRVHTPAGLDIGARTPAEVALSVFAELVAVWQDPAHRCAGLLPTARRQDAAMPLAGPQEAAAVKEVDPVCGMTVTVSAASLCHDHAGTRWYFCGPGCRQAFVDDPGRYAP